MLVVGIILILLGLLVGIPKKPVQNYGIIFKSKFTRGGSLIVPEKLIFTDNSLVWKKNYGIEYFYTSNIKKTIPYNKITGVIVYKNLIGCNVEIVGMGVQSIFASCFSEKDADEIESMINSLI